MSNLSVIRRHIHLDIHPTLMHSGLKTLFKSLNLLNLSRESKQQTKVDRMRVANNVLNTNTHLFQSNFTTLKSEASRDYKVGIILFSSASFLND